MLFRSIDNSIQMALTGVLLASFALFSFIGLYILLKNLPTTKELESLDIEKREPLNEIFSEEILIGDNIEIKERIMWSPIIIIAGIFIYSNWFYFFY